MILVDGGYHQSWFVKVIVKVSHQSGVGGGHKN